MSGPDKLVTLLLHFTAYRELERLRELRAVPDKTPTKARLAEAVTERADPLTHHMMESDLYWSPQPSDAS